MLCCNEDDGCQFVEEAVRERVLSIRSCTRQPHVGAAVSVIVDQPHNDATIAKHYFLTIKKKINVIPLFNHHEGSAKTPVSSQGFQESIKPIQHETNIMEGSEFLD